MNAIEYVGNGVHELKLTIGNKVSIFQGFETEKEAHYAKPFCAAFARVRDGKVKRLIATITDLRDGTVKAKIAFTLDADGEVSSKWLIINNVFTD